MASLSCNIAFDDFSKYWLDDDTSVHWVNENSCLLQIEPVAFANNDELIAANQKVQLWRMTLLSRMPQWLENYVPAYTSLLIVHDLTIADKFLVLSWLKDAREAIQLSPNGRTTQQMHHKQETTAAAKHHVIDVCYSPQLSDALQHRRRSHKMPNDLPAVSEHTGLDQDEIIRLHTAPSYSVFTVGFLPNFAYMGLTPMSLNMPRLSSPRKNVPAGAVAIADNQTAIYPQSSPGGWHILGYTALKLGVNGDTVFQAGDTVSFKAIDEPAFCDQICAHD